MKQLSLVALLVGLIQSSGCEIEDCDRRALPIQGAYALSGPTNTLESLRIDMGKEDVKVSYTRPDGSKWKASYRITARGKGYR